MRRVRLVLEYDGTDYSGFQRQSSRPSVQAELERRLAQVCGHPVEGVGAGRTDAGVHALGQVFHFDTTGRIPTERIPQALNSLGAPDLVVRYAEDADPGFHARYGAASRTYDYYVCRRTPDPCRVRYVVPDRMLVPDALERMRLSLPALLGEHDYAAFCGAGGHPGSTRRNVLSADVEERGDLLRFRICANGFLKSMVRNLAGWLVEIGRGRREPEALGKALASGRRGEAVATAPPHGLFLMRVDYSDGFPGGAVAEAAPFWNNGSAVEAVGRV